jgi:hypothetical protein
MNWLKSGAEPTDQPYRRALWIALVAGHLERSGFEKYSGSRLEYCLFRGFADLFLIVLPFGRSLALLIAVFLSTHGKPRMFRLITKQRCKPGRREDSEV